MYRAFFCVGLVLLSLGALLALAGFVAPLPGPNGGLVIPGGISFFATGMIIIALCDQQRRMEALRDRLVSLQAGNAELKLLAQEQSAILASMRRQEEKSPVALPTAHANGQVPSIEPAPEVVESPAATLLEAARAPEATSAPTLED